MKIGKLVKLYIPNILNYCEKNKKSELNLLMDKKYSKDKFNINFPFCIETSLIEPHQDSRYWKDEYFVQGKYLRICSQWFLKDEKHFKNYLLSRELVSKKDLQANDSELDKNTMIVNVEHIKNSRYKGKAIGDAQNAIIRNILSNLGTESFKKKDWENTKVFFSNRCAYCGESGPLQMEHAIPINKNTLGEHRLGNLVPSCKRCNTKKGAKDFREFLDDETRISKIEQYMASKNYIPLEKDNERIENILEMARQDVLTAANRYTTILNDLFIETSNQ